VRIKKIARSILW